MSQSTSEPLSQIINNSSYKKISIPIFQRPYSWENHQITQFLTDLDIVLENYNNEDEDHFLGLIVFVKDKIDSKKIDIIDGQQRLATALITLSIIRDCLTELKFNDPDLSESEISEVDELIYKCKGTIISSGTPKFFSQNESRHENEFFKKIQLGVFDFSKEDSIREKFSTQTTGEKNIYKIKEENLRMSGDQRTTKSKKSYKNYCLINSHIYKKIKSKTDFEKYSILDKYYTIITERIKFIPFSLSDYEKAFLYFEVLNDRGLEVSALDLIKNHCLMRCKNDPLKMDQIFNSWKEIFVSTLDKNANLILFTRYAYMSRKGHIQNKKIYSSYKSLFEEKDFDQIKTFLDTILLSQARVYSNITSIGSKDIEGINHKIILNAIELLKSTKTQQWYSIALSALSPILIHSFKLTKQHSLVIKELFEELHEIMFVLNFTEKVANVLEKELPRIAKNIEQGENRTAFINSLNNAIKSLNDLKIEEKLTFNNIDLDKLDNSNTFEGNNALGNMFIFFRRYKLEGMKNRLEYSSLEHILPQVVIRAAWPSFYNLNEEIQKESIYSLGNFLITSKVDNASFGNVSFEKKKALYDNSDIFDPLSEHNSLYYKNIHNKGWDIELIKKRKNELIDWYKIEFNHPGNSKEEEEEDKGGGTIKDLIKEGESESLEFKATLSYDLATKARNKILEFSVLKTIVAFNNSGGGTLLIGISDEGEAHGIENDLIIHGDEDGFQLHLTNLILSQLGINYASSKGKHVMINFIDIDDKKVCKVEIRSSSKPLYITDQNKHGKKKEKYFVRVGNQTKEIENISDINLHQKENFPKN